MPRTAIDYSKSCVYRIVYKHTTHYVGSTTNFNRRKTEHKITYNNNKSKSYNKPLYVFIREMGGWNDDWVMILVEEYPECKTSRELFKYEREYYDFYKPECNVLKPLLTIEENNEYNKQYNALYRIENAKQIQLSKREYNIENFTICECGGKYTGEHKQRHTRTKKHINFIEKQD